MAAGSDHDAPPAPLAVTADMLPTCSTRSPANPAAVLRAPLQPCAQTCARELPR